MGIDSALLQVVPHSASYKTEVLGERARKAFGNSFFFFKATKQFVLSGK